MMDNIYNKPQRSGMPVRFIKSFIKQESTGGILLMAITVLALLAANTSFSESYFALKQAPFTIGFENFHLKKNLSHWVNDGLMALFFLLVGLEIKREVRIGELSDRKKASLPLIAAFGGVLLPALCFLLLNSGTPTARGWAIPCATDIAFALAVLTLLGKKTPAGLKIFLLSVAIIDDLGAILIIAFFYSDPLNLIALAAAGVISALLYCMNRLNIERLSLFMIVGVLLWLALLKSGLHATLSGVILAFSIPLKASAAPGPLRVLEEKLHPWVIFAIMPLFAFMNAGISFSAVSMSDLTAPLSQGIQGGLLIGKPLGILFFSWIGIQCGLARLPSQVTWPHLLGIGFLTGIGFTMSLFIGGMAFSEGQEILQVKLSVLMASTLSAVLGYGLLKVLERRS